MLYLFHIQTYNYTYYYVLYLQFEFKLCYDAKCVELFLIYLFIYK